MRAQGDLLEEDLGDADAEQLGGEQRRIEQRGLALALAADEPVHQAAPSPPTPIASSSADGLAALLPHEDADDEAAHADHGEERSDHVDRPVTRVRHVPDAAAAQQHGRDDERLDQEPDAPRQDAS